VLIDVAANTPDGICCFFTSYSYMEYVINEWDKSRILQRVMDHKLLYLETKDVVETTLALDNFKRACDCGRGAVFLSVARGKVAEGIDFDRHYGRCVILFGIPYQYTLSHVLRARLNFMREKHGIRDNDFLTFDAIRQSAQCMGRIIRSKTDYGVVILADSRYNRADKRSKFPPWITQFIRESNLNLSTDVAIQQIKQFLRVAGQPIEQAALHSILLNKEQVTALGTANHLIQSTPTIRPPRPLDAATPIELEPPPTPADLPPPTPVDLPPPSPGAGGEGGGMVVVEGEGRGYDEMKSVEQQQRMEEEAFEMEMEMEMDIDVDPGTGTVETGAGVGAGHVPAVGNIVYRSRQAQTVPSTFVSSSGGVGDNSRKSASQSFFLFEDVFNDD
jgi:hypothetical protein